MKSRYLPTVKFYTHRRETSRDIADATVKHLIDHEQWFVYEPLDDGKVALTVKDEPFAHDVLFQFKDTA